VSIVKNKKKFSFKIRGTQLEEWTINPVTLSFTGKAKVFERRFIEDYTANTLIPYRLSLLVGIIFYAAFFILDNILYPEIKDKLLVIRFYFIIPILTVFYILSFIEKFKRNLQILIFLSMIIASSSIILMVKIIDESYSSYYYYTGVIIVLFFGYSFSRIRFFYGLITGLTIIFIFEITYIFFIDTPFHIFINNNFFFLSANVVGLANAYAIEYSSRKNFFFRVMLEREKKKVLDANNNLEKRVIDKTRQLLKANEQLKNEIVQRDKYKQEKSDLEYQLFQLHKIETIGTMAGGIAHDFNNILTPILGYSGMILDELQPGSNLKEDAEQIHSAAKRGKELVQKILTFRGQIDSKKEPLELNEIVKETIDLAKVSSSENITIKTFLNKDTGTVFADKTQIHQVIMNLIVNAIHAMKETGGILKVSTSKQTLKATKISESPNTETDTYKVITITDTGKGMDKQVMDRIFEPFFTTKNVGEGTGLGLSVVHGIIKNHNGFIEVDSTPGKGTTFRVYLPGNNKMSKEI
jgi:signal transduction histidine kinase